MEDVWIKVEKAIQKINKAQRLDLNSLRAEEKVIIRNYDDYRKLTANYIEFLSREQER